MHGYETDLIQRLLSVTSAHRLVAVGGEQEIHEAAQLGIVFDDQDTRHSATNESWLRGGSLSVCRIGPNRQSR